jgi:hypothetical protein
LSLTAHALVWKRWRVLVLEIKIDRRVFAMFSREKAIGGSHLITKSAGHST